VTALTGLTLEALTTSASLIGRLGVKHFQANHHCSVNVSHGLALLFGIGTKALVRGFFCQGVRHCFCPSSVSLFDLKARFFVPTRSSARPSRAGAVKVGRCTSLSTCFALASPYLDSFGHDGTLVAVGMTIRGEPAFGLGTKFLYQRSSLTSWPVQV
jgi:hypothetical protein